MDGLIIGLCGFIGSGKGTVGDILLGQYEFDQEAFANPLKDAVSVIFGWSRYLLEGDTEESRQFREQKDEYWSEKLGYNVTPRLILQKFGTEAVRNGIGQSVWLDSLEKRLRPKKQYVITDVRFKNEIELIQKLGGVMVRIDRPTALPDWYSRYIHNYPDMAIADYIYHFHPEIHQSEWDWVNEKFNYSIINNGTLDDLAKETASMLEYCYIENTLRQGWINVQR